MAVRDIFKGAIRKIRSTFFGKTAKNEPYQADSTFNLGKGYTGKPTSFTGTIRSGFPANIRPSDEVTKARFSTFSSKARYHPKSNRYIDNRTKRYISREEFLKRLAEHRKQTAFEQSKLIKPNLTDRERRELLDKFVTASDRLKKGRERNIKADIIDGLIDEYDSIKDELGIISP